MKTVTDVIFALVRYNSCTSSFLYKYMSVATKLNKVNLFGVSLSGF